MIVMKSTCDVLSDVKKSPSSLILHSCVMTPTVDVVDIQTLFDDEI